jgi:hypothetical protein
MPPGRAHTRYRWPQLDPVEGDPELRSDERKAFDAYLAKYGQQTDEKVQALYPGAAPWPQSTRGSCLTGR